MSRGRGEDFATRWSRMKRGTRAPGAEGGAKREAERGAATDPQRAPVRGGEPRDERSDEEILRELGLPDPETLKPGDDIKGFMSGAVPARIRNRVLRRLWTSNPALANLDGLIDYGEDFTDAAMVPAVLRTAYKVGRGWARDAAEDEPEPAVAERQGPAGDELEPAGADTMHGDDRDDGRDDDRADDTDSGREPAPTAATVGEGGADPSSGQAEVALDADADIGSRDAEPRPNRRSDAAPSRPAVRRMRFRFAEQ